MSSKHVFDLMYVESDDDLKIFDEWLESKPVGSVLAVDVETTATQIINTPRLFQIADCDRAFAFDMVKYWDYVADLSKFLKSYKIVAHNGAYDKTVLDFHGFDFMGAKQYEDTFLMSKVLNPMAASHGLKNLSKFYLHYEADEMADDLKNFFRNQGESWDTIPTDEPTYWTYGCLDVIYTARLYQVFKQRLDDNPILDLEYNKRVKLASKLSDATVDGLACVNKDDKYFEYVLNSRIHPHFSAAQKFGDIKIQTPSHHLLEENFLADIIPDPGKIFYKIVVDDSEPTVVVDKIFPESNSLSYIKASTGYPIYCDNDYLYKVGALKEKYEKADAVRFIIVTSNLKCVYADHSNIVFAVDDRNYLDTELEFFRKVLGARRFESYYIDSMAEIL